VVEKDTVRDGYDALAERYAAERSFDDREVAIVDRFLRSLSPPARLLDAGCGQGGPALARLPEGVSAVGVDLSRSQLERARKRVPRAALARGDMTTLPVSTDSVDAVTAFHSLIHVPEDEHQQVLDEFVRVLRPGGRLLLTEGTNPWRGTNPGWLDSDTEMAWTIAGPEATREQLRSAGFRVVGEETAADDMAEEDAEWTFFTAELEP
jgi:ubiquinone/menaquinone biosynthesis C-methylase UbiE